MLKEAPRTHALLTEVRDHLAQGKELARGAWPNLAGGHPEGPAAAGTGGRMPKTAPNFAQMIRLSLEKAL